MAITSQTRVDFASTLHSRVKGMLLAGVFLGLFLASFDQTSVATALPRLLADLQGMDLIAWVSASYLLAITVTVPLYNKLADNYGHKIVLLTGLALFGISSVLCAMSPDMLSLVALRGMQGLGAGAILSTAFSIPSILYPPAQQAKVQGLLGATLGLAGLAGPLAGGTLTDQLGWRWIFYANIPFAALAILIIALCMPNFRRSASSAVNYSGAALFAAAVGSLIAAISLDKTKHAWGSPLVLGILAMSAVLLILFYQVERRTTAAFVQRDLFRNQTYAFVAGISFSLGAITMAAILYLSLFLVNGLGLSVTTAGITLLSLTLCTFLSSVITAKWVQSSQSKRVLLTGLGLVFLSFIWLSQMDVSTTLWGVRVRLMVLGFGLGPTLHALTLVVSNAVPHQLTGLATAGRQFFQHLGQTFGAAVYGAIVVTSLTAKLETELAPVRAKLPAKSGTQLDAKVLRSGRPASAAGSENMSKLVDEAPANFVRERDLAIKAIRDHDEKASAELQKTPGLTPSMRKLLESGSVDKIVNGQLDAVKSRVYGVIRSGDFGQVTELAQDTRYPELQPTLQAITRSQLANEKQREAIVSGIDAMIEAARPGLIQVSTERTLSTIVEGFAGSEKKARQSTQETEAQVTKAVQSAFAGSVPQVYRYAIPLVVLAFLLTMGLKNNASRKIS